MKPAETTEVRIRPAGEADLEPMNRLLSELFSIEKDFTPDREKQRRGLALLLQQSDGLVLVAENGRRRTVGMCTVQTLWDPAEGFRTGLVEDVVVRREYRGRGIGRRLLAAAREWAETAGIDRLQLLADGGNQPALEFYDRIGWTATDVVCLRRHLAAKEKSKD